MAHINTTTRNEDLAWAAGLYDGEGCTNTLRDVRGAVERRYPRCTVAQKDKEVLEKFQRIMGFGTIAYHPATDTHGEMHYWQARSNAETKMVIELLWPWLGTVKRDQAQKRLGESTWHNGMKDKLICKNPSHEVVTRLSSGRRCLTCQKFQMYQWRRKKRLVRIATLYILGVRKPRMYGYKSRVRVTS